MNEKRKVILFTLLLIAIFSITTVCGRTGHGGHGHSGGHSGGHSSGGHSSGGHSSGSHSSGGHSSDGHSSGSLSSGGHSIGGHGSYGDSGYGESSIGHASHGTSGLGSHHFDEPSDSHIGSAGLSHHNSHYDPIGVGHHNSDSDFGSYDNGGINSGYYPNRHHHHQDHHYGYNDDDTARTTSTIPPPKIEEKWLDLKCDKDRLPDFMGKKYPQEEVASAVRKMKEVLSSSNGDMQNRIKFEVRTYFYTIKFQNIYGSTVDRSTECEETTSHIAPLGGCDENYSAYIIVNVPELKQEFKTTDCRTWTFCDYTNGAMCLQSKRTEKLLVLPAKPGPFNLTDFSVATFKVNNGCKCLAGDQINIFNFHDYGL